MLAKPIGAQFLRVLHFWPSWMTGRLGVSAPEPEIAYIGRKSRVVCGRV
jgi:hypothetical protein